MSGERIDVCCLCAAWCRLCGDYASVFAHVTDGLGAEGFALRAHWVDIEDDEALVGSLDIETFPTIVVAGLAGVRFAGPLTPEASTLRRVLRSVLRTDWEDRPARAPDPAVEAFARRLRASHAQP